MDAAIVNWPTHEVFGPSEFRTEILVVALRHYLVFLIDSTGVFLVSCRILKIYAP